MLNINRKDFLPILIITILLINNVQLKLVEQTYNFGNEQNYEIDLLYSHLLGHNLYFITDTEEEKTQYSVTLYPNLSLQVRFKFYTNNEIIINSLNSNKIIFFGIDLNITNTDITMESINTDIIVCGITKKDANCYDYIFDKENKKYKRNENAIISKNNLLPLNFSKVELNILQKNVISFTNYYGISFEKKYPDHFDNKTMFNWINYVASDLEQYVSGFYGIAEDDNGWNEFTVNDTIYYNSILYGDGSGYKNSSSYLQLSLFLSIIIILFTLLL